MRDQNVINTGEYSFVERILNEKKIEQRVTKQILSDDSYLLWIENYCKKNSNYLNDNVTSVAPDLSDLDTENISYLHILFNIIAKYAEENYIDSVKCDFGCFYLIRFNDMVYSIGVLAGQGVQHFCGVYFDQNENSSFSIINWEDIKAETENPKKKVIEEKIDVLQSQIEDLKKYTSNQTIKEIIYKMLG